MAGTMDDIPYLKTDEEAGAGWRSHGLPGKTLVHEGIQFYCIQCGSKLVENLHNRKLVYCSNAACQHNGWQLERPDLRGVYIIQKPKGDSNE